MKILRIVALFAIAIGCTGAYVSPPQVDGTYLFRALPGHELDEQGIPIAQPTASISMMDIFEGLVYGCANVEPGVVYTKEAPVEILTNIPNTGVGRVLMKAFGYLLPDCAGLAGNASERFGVVWFGPAGIPVLLDSIILDQ